jgi:hypothetical protein
MLMKAGGCMARTKAVLGGGSRLSDHLAVACLALNCPLGRVHEILKELGLQGQRRRDLSAEVVFFYVLALCLYRTVSYEEVLRIVVEGLRAVYGDGISDVVPTKGAISRARARLGSLPLERMYAEQVQATGGSDKPGVMYRGLRVVALDGSTLDVADEKANAQHYGYPGASRGSAACPQLRFAALAECATHVMFGAEMGAYRVSEQELARDVLRRADSSMLILADRGFAVYPLWSVAGKQSCKRIFRVRDNHVLPVIRELSDGSYISEIYPDLKTRRRAAKGKNVDGVERIRVVEYEMVNEGDSVKTYRLMTDLMDETEAPAQELASLYHRRWRVEMALDELKVYLNENMGLRSKTPDLVRQEFYALLFVHGAIRKLMVDAASTTIHVAEELSFSATFRIIRRRLPGSVAFPPS